MTLLNHIEFWVLGLMLQGFGLWAALRCARAAACADAEAAAHDRFPTIPPAAPVPHDMPVLDHELRLFERVGW